MQSRNRQARMQNRKCVRRNKDSKWRPKLDNNESVQKEYPGAGGVPRQEGPNDRSRLW